MNRFVPTTIAVAVVLLLVACGDGTGGAGEEDTTTASFHIDTIPKNTTTVATTQTVTGEGGVLVASVDRPDRRLHTFGYEFVLAEVWIVDAPDLNMISLYAKDQEGQERFWVREIWSTYDSERYEKKAWVVDPDYVYTIEVDGMGFGDEVTYRFSPLLPTIPRVGGAAPEASTIPADEEATSEGGGSG